MLQVDPSFHAEMGKYCMAGAVSSTVMLLRAASTDENEQQATRATKATERNGCIAEPLARKVTACKMQQPQRSERRSMVGGASSMLKQTGVG